MRRVVITIAALAALASSRAGAATVLFETMDTLAGWSVRTVGAGRAGENWGRYPMARR